MAQDLDCIEALRVRTGGRWVDARLVSAEVLTWIDEHLGPGRNVSSVWAYDSASEGQVLVGMNSSMSPRGVLRDGKDALDHGMLIQLSRPPDDTRPFLGEEDMECASGSLDACILWGARLPQQDLFEVSARTSWLRDNGVGVNGLDMAVSRRDIRGGSSWRFRARQVLVPHPRKWDEVTPAVGWVPRLSFQVDHAGDGLHDSAFDPRCADFGAPWKSINSAGSGRLKWSKSTQSIDFQIFSPHLDPHGRPYVGDFTAAIPLAWLRCYAGTDVRPAHLSVQVVNEDGQEKVATTAVKVHKGTVHVRATGFTFSRPTIRLSTTRPRR